MSDYLDLNNEELLKDFFAEAFQQVEQLESNILVIESDPTNKEAIDEIFRAAHTLKGGSATVEMLELSGFTHVVEDLLDEIRSDKVSVTEDVVNLLLTAIDVIKAMLDARSNGSIYDEDVEPLKNQLLSMIPGKGGATPTPPPAPAAPAPQPVAPAASQPVAADAGVISDITMEECLSMEQLCQPGTQLWRVIVMFDESNPMNSVGGIQVFASLKDLGDVLKTSPDFDELYTDTFFPQVIYYMTSSADMDSVEDAAFIDDVTLSVDARVVSSKTSVFGAPGAVAPAAPSQLVAETPVAPTPAAAPESQPEATSSPAASAASAASTPAAASSAKGKAAATQTGSLLRVDSKRIDYLLNLVSEAVIVKAAFNQIAMQISDIQSSIVAANVDMKNKFSFIIDAFQKYAENCQKDADIRNILDPELLNLPTIFDASVNTLKVTSAKFRSQTQVLGRVAGELQEGVMKIRMVPINQIFSRFPRVVRDLSRDLSKKVKLVIEGEETELDKSVIDDLLDPIMHCVRNSLDHGIEQPNVRAAAGKNEEGVIRLTANNEGNMIVIEISDDGGGINVQKVKERAIERQVIAANAVLSDHECYQLLFEPGFSTAEKITSVSGRGVGLDVVKTQIEKLNGTVTVSSEPGKGTTFTIRLPLTLAILQGLLVRVGQEIYAIPIASVLDSHRIKPEEISTLDNHEVLTIRDEVISLVRLAELFEIPCDEDPSHHFIVIVGAGDKKLGVMVDALIGEEDVVIKPLNDNFANSQAIAGASILGDGSVTLIIDVAKLIDLGLKRENLLYAEAMTMAIRGN
ncbi:MAG: chemotaxis protein CheA [Spirochaetaceae bacterium]|nr:chemotaxis protein CheA [Spirochaetaceae bacterium]